MKYKIGIPSLIIIFLIVSTPASSKPAVDAPIPNTVTTLNVELAQDIKGNRDVVVISQQWTSAEISIGFVQRFMKVPMTKNDSGYWEAEINWATDLPDKLKMLFSSGDTTDRNIKDGVKNYWIITPEYSDHRVEMIDPNLSTPRITTSESTLNVEAKGPSTATSWKLNITGRSETPISISATSSTNVQDDWNLTFTLPTLAVGLYDLTLYATSGGKIRSDFEPHSLRIIETTPDEYIIAAFGDQEISSDGTRGTFNISQILSEVSIVNPLFVVNLGSVSSLADEATFRIYREYLQKFCSVPQYMATGHREMFEGPEGDGISAGVGAFESIIGPRNRDWWIGDHFYTSIFPGDHRPSAEDVTFLENSLASASAADLKVIFLHDPIMKESGAPSYIDTSLYEQCIKNDPQRTDIFDAMTDNNVDYYVHASVGIDGSQDDYFGVTHISVSGATNGFRLITVKNDAFESWGNSAGANGIFPLGKLSISYKVDGTAAKNDGSHSELTGVLTNDHSDPFTNAKIPFKMPKSTVDYVATEGIIESQYTMGDYTYVDVLVNVTQNSEVTTTVSPGTGGAPIENSLKVFAPKQDLSPSINPVPKIQENNERAGWTPLNPSVGDKVKIWYLPVETESTEKTSEGGAAPFPLIGVVIAIISLVIVHHKRK
ncbi:MAG: hypothetical protein ACFFFH_14350 [Candidatus Thorarchaeota archaeon]